MVTIPITIKLKEAILATVFLRFADSWAYSFRFYCSIDFRINLFSLVNFFRWMNLTSISLSMLWIFSPNSRALLYCFSYVYEEINNCQHMSRTKYACSLSSCFNLFTCSNRSSSIATLVYSIYFTLKSVSSCWFESISTLNYTTWISSNTESKSIFF